MESHPWSYEGVLSCETKDDFWKSINVGYRKCRMDNDYIFDIPESIYCLLRDRFFDNSKLIRLTPLKYVFDDNEFSRIYSTHLTTMMNFQGIRTVDAYKKNYLIYWKFQSSATRLMHSTSGCNASGRGTPPGRCWIGDSFWSSGACACASSCATEGDWLPSDGDSTANLSHFMHA